MVQIVLVSETALVPPPHDLASSQLHAKLAGISRRHPTKKWRVERVSSKTSGQDAHLSR